MEKKYSNKKIKGINCLLKKLLDIRQILLIMKKRFYTENM